MSKHKGDLNLNSVIPFKFTTNNTSGAPSTLSAATVKVYKDSDTGTETTTGVTLTTDFDSITGLNNVAIDTSSDGTFYAAGHDFEVILTAGTVDSTSVNATIGSFSILNRSALRPTTAGRTLDVATTGEAGLDFDNIKDATGSHTLTNITVPVVTSVTNGVTVSTNNDKTGYTLSSAGIQAIWDALTSALTTIGSIGKLLVTNVDATISSRAPSATAVSNADYTSARAVKIDNLDVTVSSRLASASYTAPDNATISTINTKIGTPSVTVSADIATRASQVSVNAIPTNPLLTTDTRLDHLDADISSRLPTSSYTAPDNATISTINTKIGFPVATVSLDIADKASQASVTAIQNNTNFVGVVPELLVLPDSGTKTYKILVRIFDEAGSPEDPDSNTVDITITEVDGTTVVASTAMTRTGVGQYYYDYTINYSDTAQPLIVYFDYEESAIAFNQVRTTEVTPFETDVALLISRIGIPVDTIADDIASVKSDTTTINSNVDDTISSRASQSSVDTVNSNVQIIIANS